MKIGSIAQAIVALQRGDVVGMPTETVYGLAGRIDQRSSIEKIFQVKKRPFFDPLIVHVSDIQMAQKLTTIWNPLIEQLTKVFWPGPLTLVLPKSTMVDDLVTSGLQSVGIRMPRHPMALELIRQIQVPLAAPSANQFGRTSPTRCDHVLSEFLDYESVVLDGGESEIGLESTVLAIFPEDKNSEAATQEFMQGRWNLSILRAGMILEKDIRVALKEFDNFKFLPSIEKKMAPGQMKHHYMPSIPLILFEQNDLMEFPSELEVLKLAEQEFDRLPDKIDEVPIKKPKSFHHAERIFLDFDPILAARRFYSQLREASSNKEVDVLYMVINEGHREEIWKALMDRLTKAASLRFRKNRTYWELF